MNSDRNRRIEDLFGRAWDLPISERAEFLKIECSGDESLFARIDELLELADGPEFVVQSNWVRLADLLACNDQRNADANTVCGLLGIQLALFQEDQLVDAIRVWMGNKLKPVGVILLEQGVLTRDSHCLLDSLVEKHLELHDFDTESSLAAVNCIQSLNDKLVALNDRELTASLSMVTLIDLKSGSSSHENGNATSIGNRFRVLRFHARGGLGEVFVAQDGELHREVALKEIQNRFANNRESRSRFLREAEITGGLEHPGIVPVYGLGKYADGRPYYAMRFIRGDNLRDAVDRFHQCDPVGRDPGERAIELRKLLGRFIDVCDAMEYAHSRGVLHRDLKPGNIMLGKYGETLVVDWGLAKTIEGDEQNTLTEESILRLSPAIDADPTAIGSKIGTPAYMSPEQAGGLIDELGCPSDVYSLGATLYYVLTGKPAIEGTDLDEVFAKVRRGEFDSPRVRMKTVTAALNAVCLKAMALDPANRYSSPRQLSNDIELWLADEPVSCLVEPWTIRTRRWMKRHRTTVVSSAVGLAAMIIGLVVVMGLVASHNRELREKNQQLDTANFTLENTNVALTLANKSEHEAKLAADNQRIEAEQARDDTANALDYLVGAFRLPDPMYDGEKVTVSEMLGQAEGLLEKEFAERPLFRAQLLTAIGKTYLGLSLFDKATVAFSRALELRRTGLSAYDKKTLAATDNLANCYMDSGEVEKAMPLYKEANDQMSAHYAVDDHDALSVRTHLSHAYLEMGKVQDAIGLLEQNLGIQRSKFGLDDLSTLSTMNMLAQAYAMANRAPESVPLLEVALEHLKATVGPNHVDTLATTNTLCGVYLLTGKAALAVPLCETILAYRKEKLGIDHAATLEAMNNLAVAYNDSGRRAEAIPLYEKSLEMLKSKLGLDHPNTIQSMINLAAAYKAEGRVVDALPHYKLGLELLQRRLDPDHPKTLVTMHNFAKSYELADRIGDALPLYEKALELLLAKKGIKDAESIVEMLSLANAYYVSKQPNKAELLFAKFLSAHGDPASPKDGNYAGLLAQISAVLMQNHEFGHGTSYLRECLTIRESLAPDDWTTFNTQSMLGGCLLGQQNFLEAEPLLLSGFNGLKQREDKIPVKSRSKLIESAQRIVDLYKSQELTEKASIWQIKLDELSLAESQRAKSANGNPK